jgi:hypothetical protein
VCDKRRYLAAERPMILRTARSDSDSRALSTALSSRSLCLPSGRRLSESFSPNTRTRAMKILSRAPRIRSLRRSFKTSASRSALSRSKTSKVTTSLSFPFFQSLHLDRGTPQSLAKETSPVRKTRSRSRGS